MKVVTHKGLAATQLTTLVKLENITAAEVVSYGNIFKAQTVHEIS
jgi:hypothetical protein